ncbi:hypothetical protein ACSLPC_27870 [Escherichia coli]|uniref:hypothetical protein n=1 Tax=Escherichia coli TaxID=562 RepID=UPI003EE0187C
MTIKRLGQWLFITAIIPQWIMYQKSFFGKYYTWTDGESYRKRASNLGELITDDLKNNKKIFDEGKDTFGGDYINISGLKSEFRSVSTNIVNDIEDENKLIGLVKVEFENWYFDKKSEAAIAFKYYLVSYDKKGQNINKAAPNSNIRFFFMLTSF